MLDKGLPPKFIESYLKVCGDYIDFVKFGWGTSAIMNKDVVKEKISYYNDYNIDVYPGGTLFECAVLKNKLDQFFEEALNLGFSAIEISDGSLDISLDLRKEAIKKARSYGLKVLTEVGKKLPEKDKELNINKRVEMIKFDLSAGADYVIIEGRESGRGIGIYDEKGNVKEDLLKAIEENVDINKLIFEAPNKNQQVYFILRYGPSVNLANISYEDVVSLETLRRGLRGDTFNKLQY